MATTSEYRELARKAESELNWRMAIVYWRRALDAYPHNAGKLAQADREKMITAMNADKQMLTSICPVCGDHMLVELCPDDIRRPSCPSCKRTYTPMGYDCQDDYALKWYATKWDMTETSEVIEVRA